MARCRNPVVVLGPDGKPLAGASVQTNTRPGGSAAAVYTTETGATAASNPATTDEHGKVVQWVDRGAYASVVSATGLTTYTEPWDSAPGGDGAIDEAWLAAIIEQALHQPGDLRVTAVPTVETGWLACDGSAVNRETYAALFAAIGTTYGAGNGTTTFNVPDYRGRTVVGAGAGSGLTARARGDKSGEESHTLAATESGVAAHSHAITDGGHTHAGTSGHNIMQDSGPEHFKVEGSGFGIGTSAATASAATGISVNNASAAPAASAHNNMPPYLVSNVWIKT